jgi:hypothetical protein
MGKHKDIGSPEIMWDLFEQYKKEIKSSPFKVHQLKTNKDGILDGWQQREKPLTLVGFEVFVANKGFCHAGLHNYFANTGGMYNDYLTICARIRAEIRQDHTEGAMAEVYNPAVTARLNGWADKQETTFQEQPLFPKE